MTFPHAIVIAVAIFAGTALLSSQAQYRYGVPDAEPVHMYASNKIVWILEWPGRRVVACQFTPAQQRPVECFDRNGRATDYNRRGEPQNLPQ